SMGRRAAAAAGRRRTGTALHQGEGVSALDQAVEERSLERVAAHVEYQGAELEEPDLHRRMVQGGGTDLARAPGHDVHRALVRVDAVRLAVGAVAGRDPGARVEGHGGGGGGRGPVVIGEERDAACVMA